jgi:anhydro-N-acetylmuramic acid kinase
MSELSRSIRGAKPVVTALGLMSGTSLDGIDAAFVRTDGVMVSDVGPAITVAYTDAEREILGRAITAAAGYRRRSLTVPADVVIAADLVTEAHGRVVERLIRSVPSSIWSAEVIGFHGQTILHRPADNWTWQIGDGANLARRLGVPVVDDFRSADVAAGGQGAPLAPLYHQALANSVTPREQGPVAVVNIGGVANVTWIGDDGTLLAFDTGPGNGLLDDWMIARKGQAADWDGKVAASGRVDEAVLANYMGHDYFHLPPPKSLDRHDFNLDAASHLSEEDGAATLTAFTARAIAEGRRFFPAPAARWLVCGGGRHNPTLMAELQRALNAPVMPVEAVGWRGDAMEAEAFAFLAVASSRGLPLSFPGTTGVASPMTGGRVNQPTD